MTPIDIAALKECISENQIQNVKWNSSNEKLIDVLSKQVANPYMYSWKYVTMVVCNDQ